MLGKAALQSFDGKQLEDKSLERISHVKCANSTV